MSVWGDPFKLLALQARGDSLKASLNNATFISVSNPPLTKRELGAYYPPNISVLRVARYVSIELLAGELRKNLQLGMPVFIYRRANHP